MPEAPTLVVVSGPAGSGKTTLARAIAGAIPCPVISRDEIKEGMAHAHSSDFRGETGDPLTQRTLPVFFEVVRTLLTSGVTVVAEAAFQDRLWRPNLEPLAALARLRVIQCHLDPAIAFERAARRSVESAHRRRTHADSTIGRDAADWAQAFASFDRVSIDAPSLDVDTTQGYSPDLGTIVGFVNRD
jgi:predicted kinase